MPSGSSAAPNRPIGSCAAPSGASAYEESYGYGRRPTASKKLAEECGRSARPKSSNSPSTVVALPTTLAEAVVSYLEEAAARQRFLDRVARPFRNDAAGRIDQEAIDQGARKVYPNASGATRDRQFYTPVSAVMKHAAKRGWCAPFRSRSPREAARQGTGAHDREANRLIDACGDHLRPLVIFLLYTGARVGEALWLDWREVDLDRRHVSSSRPRTAIAVACR